jgi:hypothetical protein
MLIATIPYQIDKQKYIARSLQNFCQSDYYENLYSYLRNYSLSKIQKASASPLRSVTLPHPWRFPSMR